MPLPRSLAENHFDVLPSSVPGLGMGLFARVPIETGQTVGYYTGKIITDKMADRKPYIDSLYLLYICKDHWILGEGPLSNYTRYINHDGDHPNVELVVSTRWKSARFYALRPISPGEELFFDYGAEYWDALGVIPNPVTRAA